MPSESIFENISFWFNNDVTGVLNVIRQDPQAEPGKYSYEVSLDTGKALWGSVSIVRTVFDNQSLFPIKHGPEPHQKARSDGWSLVPFAIRRHMNALKLHPEAWETMDMEELPAEVRNKDDIDPNTELESIDVDPAKEKEIVDSLYAVVRRFEFVNKQMTKIGLYLSTELTTAEVSVGVKSLERQQILLCSTGTLQEKNVVTRKKGKED